MKIIARKEAKATGLKRYFTGKPCKHGHVAERCVSGRACVVCVLETAAAWYAAHRDEQLARAAARYARNLEKVRARHAAYRARNPERERARHAAWQKNNPGMVCAHTAKRKARKLRATPPWSNPELIKAVYEAAARKGLVVDHVIPLKHPLVCGLHVPFNLQLLTASANSAKGNTWPPIRL